MEFGKENITTPATVKTIEVNVITRESAKKKKGLKMAVTVLSYHGTNLPV